MTQIFKQKNNVFETIGFVGLIAVSQLMIYNMGYVMPMYFWIVLGIMSAIIVWSMIDTRYIIDGELMKIKVGPFIQKIKIADIQSIETMERKKGIRRIPVQQVKISYGNNKKLMATPADAQSFANALRPLISKRN